MKNRTLFFILATAFLLTGCSHKKLVFTTRTSAGLDVSGTSEIPDKVSFTYSRQELSIVPRKADGDAHSVYGGLDTDIGWWTGSIIKQTFATGQAAEYASGGSSDLWVTSTNDNKNSLVFCTSTTFGLHLTAGEGQIQPNLLMGYRRWEGAYIPVPDPNQEVRPVYADILINSKSAARDSGNTNAASITTNWPTSSTGVRIKQSFATGRAAVNLAGRPAIRAKLKEAAGAEEAMAVNAKRAAELRQQIATEVNALRENQLNAAGGAARDAELVTDITGFAGLSSFEKARQLRAVANDKQSESDIRKLEQYLVELRKLTKSN